MPLSDHEQKLLDQLERALASEDPKLASALRGGDLRRQQRRRVAVAVVAMAVGVVLLVGGLLLSRSARPQAAMLLLSAAGFVLLVLGASWGTIALRQLPRPRRARAAKGGVVGHGVPRPAGGSFMGRVEERWRRRRGLM